MFKDVEREIDNEILKRDLLALLDQVFGEEFTADPAHESEIINMEAYLERKKQGITAKELILLHFGLFGKRMSFNDIADHVNLSVPRLAFLEAKAIHKIRTSDHVLLLVEHYGYEFRITVEKWKESMDQKTVAEAMTDKIDALDQLLSSFI